MRLDSLASCLILSSSFFIATAQGAHGDPATPISIASATKSCEIQVQDHCLSTSCPTYCSRERTPEKREQCKKECTTEKRCKLRSLASMNDKMNQILDAQNREQLMQCIAQLRDPEGKKSGRRMIDWKDVKTPSFAKMLP